MANDPTTFREVSHKSLWLPHYAAGSVLDIPVDFLVHYGMRCIILDIDDTLVPRRTNRLDPALTRYFEEARRTGIQLFIGSNAHRDIADIATAIGARVVPRPWWSRKPMKAFYETILAESGTTPQSTAMVGNHILNDIVGANRLGLVTILVTPLGRKPGILRRSYQKLLR